MTIRRSWPHSITIALVMLVAIASFGTAASLALGQWALSDRQLVDIGDVEPDDETGLGSTVIIEGSTVIAGGGESGVGSPTATSIVLAEPEAANFLVVGADNNDCVDVVDPSTEDRAELGERSDTIMIWRANPDHDQLAVLSLPRDLWVDVPGGSKARINSTFRRNDPSRLIETIDRNFGIPIDHYVQIDFCAFREIVDAVGGVTVPFAAPARDEGAGLFVPTAGCVNLDGDTALSYVRSRKYEYEDPPGSGNWERDPTSDFGRISRQQDFLRRVVAKVIDNGLYSPRVATALIEANREYVVTDVGLTLQRMLEFGNTLRRLDPSEITTYRIESIPETTADGAKVERPRINGENMQAVLDVFRGAATLESAPEQAAESPTAPATASSDSSSDGDDNGDDRGSPTASSTADAVTTTTLPAVDAEENVVGVVPDRDLVCD